MENLAFSAAISGNLLLFPSLSLRKRGSFVARKGKVSVLASGKEEKEERNLNEWDQMELKFGRLLGEDPKLTLAKIMARKINPDASYIEVEKSFYKNKGKMVEVEEVPLDWSKEKKPSSSLDGLNLVRPVPKRGVKFETNEKPAVPAIKKPSQSLKKPLDSAIKGRVPNVILRKPSIYYEDDGEDKSSKLRFKPNLSLRIGNEQSKEKFSDITLLTKPELIKSNMDPDKNEESSSINLGAGITNGSIGFEMEKEGEDGAYVDFTLLKKPEAKLNTEEEQEEVGASEVKESSVNEAGSVLKDSKAETESTVEMQHLDQSTVEETARVDTTNENLVNSHLQVTQEATLQGKPQRLDHLVTETSISGTEQEVLVNNNGHGNLVELKDPPSRSALEESDWFRAEDMLKTDTRAVVELISSSTRGFAVSFGSLIGFLPYRNLAAKWKFLAFESWLRRKGLDPSMYRQNLGVIGSPEAMNRSPSPDSSLDSEVDKTIEGEISSDLKLEDLLMIYDKEKHNFLLSFVGQKIKVNVVMVDKNSRKLIFSMRPREKEEAVEKKRTLMAKLRVGDVVKCCIKKITYFGIFVEVEGVPALIHQTEVSWDATLDPASDFKIGQIVEAKVHQLDFALERIFLSLKEITPDPLTEALESVVGDHDQLGGRLQAAEADSEWADVESLIKELERIEGIQSVSKGRFFLSPGLAPTFQVYMASMFENQYKLLARAGNKVQELIVEAFLSKEEMKSTIMSCTNKVE